MRLDLPKRRSVARPRGRHLTGLARLASSSSRRRRPDARSRPARGSRPRRPPRAPPRGSRRRWPPRGSARPARSGVARFVRARHWAPSTSTTPSGSTATTASPSSPTIQSRPMVGVAKRVRTIDGMPTMNASSTPTMPTASVSHPMRNSVNRNHDADDEGDDAGAGPEAGHAGLHVDGEAEDRRQQERDRPRPVREGEHAVAPEHDADRRRPARPRRRRR